MIYLGFTVDQMINFLNEHCVSFVLVKNDNKEIEGDFRLTVISDEFGEHESYGCLSRIVAGAFKPFVSQARIQRDEKKKILSEIFSILQD